MEVEVEHNLVMKMKVVNLSKIIHLKLVRKRSNRWQLRMRQINLILLVLKNPAAPKLQVVEFSRKLWIVLENKLNDLMAMNSEPF